MSKTIVHPSLCIEDFNPFITLSQEQIAILLSTETTRQAYEQLGIKRNAFKITSNASFEYSDDRIQGTMTDVIENHGYELADIDTITATISTKVQHCESRHPHGVIEKEYVATFDKDKLCKFIKDTFVAPNGFNVLRVDPIVSFRNSRGSTLTVKVTLTLISIK